MPLEIPELSSGNPQLQRALAKIVKVEQKGVDKVDEKIQVVDNKIKLMKELKDKFGKVRESITPFRSVNDFRDLKAESSHPEVVSVSSVDKSLATPGSYEFEVKDLAASASLMTTGAPDRDKSELGVGYVSFKTPDGKQKEIYINSDNNTLDGIAKSINNAGAGVKAQVVNDGTDGDAPWRLVLSSEKTGQKNNVDWAEFNLLDGDLDIDKYRSREAKSASIYFNGQPMYVDENTVKTLLPGAVINFNKAQPGQTVKIQIKPDIEKIEGKAKNFVDSINSVFSFMHNQSATDQNSRKDPSKALSGDTSLLSLQNRMNQVIQRPVDNGNGQIQRLADVGITFNRSGMLDYDPKKFQSALEAHFEEVERLFSGNGPLSGVANELGSLIDGFSRSNDGILTIREKTFQDQVKTLQKDKEKKTTVAEGRIDRAKTQFAKAEAAIEEMQKAKASLGGG